MLRRFTAGLALSLTILTAGASSASAVSVFTTTLSGSEERPGPGDPNGSGFAVVAAIPETGQICYGLAVFGLGPVTAAHIHEAPAGVPGPIVVPLAPPTQGASGGCVANAEEAEDIAANPEDYYVNVHTTEFPGGAIRGQLG
jgi:hypothetical protein